MPAPQGGSASEFQFLSLPRPPRAGETAFIEVQVGPIGRREIDASRCRGSSVAIRAAAIA